MNSLDIQYQTLLKTILEHGVVKKDRTGTGTKSIFGYTIRHDMKEGFPLLTTKKMAWKGIVSELIWFLRGDTNIRYLVEQKNYIWVGDAYKNYTKHTSQNSSEWNEWMRDNGDGTLSMYTESEFIEKIRDDAEFAKKWGELGPVYGKQWRSWAKTVVKKSQFDDIPIGYRIEWIDQIANLISDLKKNPDSRRLMVTAWNPAEIDQMVLPPCHYGFQFYTRELSLDERRKIILESDPYGIEPSDNWTQQQLEDCKELLDEWNIPTRAISLLWNQRSVDTFLGLPFNIASYGLLLEIIAKMVNMVPDQLIGNLGDTHLYLNHLEQAREQIGRELALVERIDLASKDKHFDPGDFGIGDQVTEEHCHNICDMYKVPRSMREPFELPKLVHGKTEAFYKALSESLTLFGHLEPSAFSLENYQSHPAIKAELSN
jgi:thymidylate synthase